MVHGGDPRSLSHSADFSTIWSTSRLRPRLLAYDKPGQGRSFDRRDPTLGSDAEGLVAHLREVVRATTSGPVVLLGHSRGALPVLAVAASGEPRIAGVVIVSSNTLAPPSPSTPADFYPRMYAVGPEGPGPDYVAREATANSYGSDHLPDLVAGRGPIAEQPGWWGSRAARHAAHDDRLLPGLGQLRSRVLLQLEARPLSVPVLTLWGTEDVSAPESLAVGLLAVLRRGGGRSDYVALTGARHYVYRDRAAAFTAHLEAWLDGLSGWVD